MKQETLASNDQVTNKVVTITLNPALDLTGNLHQLHLGELSLVDTGSLHAAGKGVNVAKVLSDLGAEVTVTGFLGRDNDTAFRKLFSEMDAQDKFIRVEGATRINVKLIEDNERVSEINFPGVHVSEEDIMAFEDELFDLAKTHQYFVLAGSLPAGISPERSALWIEKLQSLGKKVIFDSSRDAFACGVEAQPWLIKPNLTELSEYVAEELKTQKACQQVAQSLSDKGIANVVVSLGEKGVMWLSNEVLKGTSWHYSLPPKMQLMSTVGAGDSLVASLCWGSMQLWEKSETLKFATAASALAVSQIGVGVPDIQAIKTLQDKVAVNHLLE